MVNPVTFDGNGIPGNALALIYRSQFMNTRAVTKVTATLNQLFLSLAKIEPEKCAEFCVFVGKVNTLEGRPTPTEVIGSKYFQSMAQTSRESVAYTRLALFIVPHLLELAKNSFPEAVVDTPENQKVQDWLARCMLMYMSAEEIDNECRLYLTIPMSLTEERIQLGEDFRSLTKSGKLDKVKLEHIFKACDSALTTLKEASDLQMTLTLSSRLLTFLAKADDPVHLAGVALPLLQESLTQHADSEQKDARPSSV